MGCDGLSEGTCEQFLMNKTWLDKDYRWSGLKSISKGQCLLAFNVIRNIARALFKQDTTKSASLAAKKKIAGLDDDYR